MLNQIVSTIDLLENHQYTRPLNVFNGSTLGQHFRHIFDFYNCIIRDAGGAMIDYARRERDPRLEEDCNFAGISFRTLANKIELLSEKQQIGILGDFGESSAEEKSLIQTTIGRELLYAFDHAVHHLAIIKIGIKTNFPEVNIDENLGVAPSTQKYWSSEPSKT